MIPVLALKNRPCIYAIINRVNGKIYIGKTSCIYRRCYQYLNAFKKQNIRKINSYLMNSFNKYGIENFEMSVIEFCNLEKIACRELYWISELTTTDRHKGYNLRLDSSTGMVTHQDTSRKISNNLKLQWKSGVRSQHSEKLKKNWQENPDRKESQSRMFTECKTKYIYIVRMTDGNSFILNYKGLKAFKLHSSVLSCFNRHDGEIHFCKNYSVERLKYVKSKT